jgi:hypothetical protein
MLLVGTGHFSVTKTAARIRRGPQLGTVGQPGTDLGSEPWSACAPSGGLPSEHSGRMDLSDEEDGPLSQLVCDLVLG